MTRPWAEQRARFESAQMLVRFFYAVTLYLVSTYINLWDRWRQSEALYPLWPIAWARLTRPALAVDLIMTMTYTALIAAALAPERRGLRIAAFVALLEYAALTYSFGRVGHGWNVCLAVAFMLTLLPATDRGGAVAMRQRYLLVVWAALAFLLLTYTLSGFWKVYYGGLQWWHGAPNSFSPSAFAHHIAQKLLKPPSTSMLGPFIIDHPAVGWLPYLATIYFELCSFIVAFRPALHRVWGVVLIVFHVASYLTMTIMFSRNVLLLAVFCVGSPFAPPTVPWRAVVRALPGVGLSMAVYRRLRGSGLAGPAA